jgi:transposase
MSARPRVGGSDGANAPREMALRPPGARGAGATNAAGIAPRRAPLQAVPPTLLVLEAPGGYPRAVGAALAAAGVPGAVGTPRQARDVAQAPGPWAQTEVLEARAVSPVAEAVRPTPQPLPDAQAGARRALLARRQPLVAMRTAAQHRLGNAPPTPPDGHPGA